MKSILVAAIKLFMIPLTNPCIMSMQFTSQVVLKDASSRSADEARPIYEQLITFFPTSGKFWKLWIDHEVKYRY